MCYRYNINEMHCDSDSVNLNKPCSCMREQHTLGQVSVVEKLAF